MGSVHGRETPATDAGFASVADVGTEAGGGPAPHAGLSASFIQHVLPHFLQFQDLLQATLVCHSWRVGCQGEVSRRLQEAAGELGGIRLRVGTWGTYHTAEVRSLLLLFYCNIREGAVRSSSSLSNLMEWDEDVIWVWQQEFQVDPGFTVWLGSGLSHDGCSWHQEVEYIASKETAPGDDACVIHLRFTVPCAGDAHPIATLEGQPTMQKQLRQFLEVQKGLHEARCRGTDGQNTPRGPSGMRYRWQLGIRECTINSAFHLSWLGCPQTALCGYFSQSEDATRGTQYTPLRIHLYPDPAAEGLQVMFASPGAFRTTALTQLERLEASIAKTLEETPILVRSEFKEIQVPDMRCGGFTSHFTNEIVFRAADTPGILRGHHARARALRTYISHNAESLHTALGPMVPWPVLDCLGLFSA